MSKNINDIANKKFKQIKNKSIWKVIAAKAIENKPIDRDKINAAFQDKSDIDIDLELIDINQKASKVLDFLENIELNNDLKIAISYICASNAKDKESNLRKALMIIERKLNNDK